MDAAHFAYRSQGAFRFDHQSDELHHPPATFDRPRLAYLLGQQA
jgi:hypothetical protein